MMTRRNWSGLMSMSPAPIQLEIWHLGGRRRLWGYLLQQRGLRQDPSLPSSPWAGCPVLSTPSRPRATLRIGAGCRATRRDLAVVPAVRRVLDQRLPTGPFQPDFTLYPILAMPNTIPACHVQGHPTLPRPLLPSTHHVQHCPMPRATPYLPPPAHRCIGLIQHCL